MDLLVVKELEESVLRDKVRIRRAWWKMPLQVGAARGIVGKHLDELPVRAWVVATGHRGDLRYRHLARGTHRYILGQEELTDHPPVCN